MARTPTNSMSPSSREIYPKTSTVRPTQVHGRCVEMRDCIHILSHGLLGSELVADEHERPARSMGEADCVCKPYARQRQLTLMYRVMQREVARDGGNWTRDGTVTISRYLCYSLTLQQHQKSKIYAREPPSDEFLGHYKTIVGSDVRILS